MVVAEVFGEAGAVGVDGALVQGGAGGRTLGETRVLRRRGRVGGEGGVGKLIEAGRRGQGGGRGLLLSWGLLVHLGQERRERTRGAAAGGG